MIAESVYARADARALLGVALACRDAERVEQDMRALAEQWNGSPELRQLCHSRSAARLFLVQGLARQVWGSTFTETSLAFLDRLADMGHLHLIPLITEQFQKLADRAAGRHAVEAVFTCEPSPDDLARIQKKLDEAFGTHYKLAVHVDPAQLAGLRIRVDDRLIDATLSGRIARLKRGLLKPMRPQPAAAGEPTEPI